MTRISKLAAAFAPHEDLAAVLLPHAFAADDGSHDAAHLIRVWKNAARIQAEEGGDPRSLAAAVLLHDCVSVEKNSPLRTEASRLAAEKATGILRELGWDAEETAAVAHAILTHSFSANIEPETLEARILQDADRLDAIGMVGAARCFYIAGRMGAASMTRSIRWRKRGRSMTRLLPSIISRPSSSGWPMASRPRLAAGWRRSASSGCAMCLP